MQNFKVRFFLMAREPTIKKKRERADSAQLKVLDETYS